MNDCRLRAGLQEDVEAILQPIEDVMVCGGDES